MQVEAALVVIARNAAMRLQVHTLQFIQPAIGYYEIACMVAYIGYKIQAWVFYKIGVAILAIDIPALKIAKKSGFNPLCFYCILVVIKNDQCGMVFARTGCRYLRI